MSNVEPVGRMSQRRLNLDFIRRIRALEALTDMGTGPYLTYQAVNNGDSEAVILAEPGVVYGWYIANTDLDFAFVKLYNLATTPTLGSDTSQENLGIPPELGANQMAESGIEFDTGIAIAISNSANDSVSTNPPNGTVTVNILFLPS